MRLDSDPRRALARLLPQYGHSFDGLEKCGITVDRASHGEGRRVVVTLPTPARLQVHFSQEGVGAKLTKWFRAELQIGDAAFDQAVYVDTDGDRAELSRWLGESTLREAIRGAVTGGGSVRVEGPAVTWEQPRGVLPEVTVVRLVRLALGA